MHFIYMRPSTGIWFGTVEYLILFDFFFHFEHFASLHCDLSMLFCAVCFSVCTKTHTPAYLLSVTDTELDSIRVTAAYLQICLT